MLVVSGVTMVSCVMITTVAEVRRSLLKWHNGAFVPWGLFAQRLNRSLVAELAEPELVLKVVLLLSFFLSFLSLFAHSDISK